MTGQPNSTHVQNDDAYWNPNICPLANPWLCGIATAPTADPGATAVSTPLYLPFVNKWDMTTTPSSKNKSSYLSRMGDELLFENLELQ